MDAIMDLITDIVGMILATGFILICFYRVYRGDL